MHLSNVYDLFSFKQLIQEPTRENLGSRTIIDHIATNVERNIGHHGVIRVSMSDHYLVYCIRKLNGALKRDHKFITNRVMKRFSEIDFIDDVAKVPWEQVVQSSNDINELVIKWYRPPSDPIISFDLLEKVLSSLDSEEKEIILIGDTNCDFAILILFPN